jgi:hypothetical protein
MEYVYLFFVVLLELSAIFGILFFFAFLAVRRRKIRNVHSHWHHLFETRLFAPLEFYHTLQDVLNEKGMHEVTFYSVIHSEKGLLSANREYLRIKYKEYLIDVCAAPFAKEALFVSWWLGDGGITFRDILIHTPLLGWLFKRRPKTFYEQDTELMFKEMTARCIKETIEMVTQTKGVRLTDAIDWEAMDRKRNAV